MLRREAERLGYTSSFTIYDQADQVRVVRACLEDLGVDPKRFTPRGIHSQISNAKNQLIGPDEYMSRVASFYDKTVAEVYERYQRRLIGSNAVDFDDMLMLTVEALERFPDALAHWQHTFRYILVDEYQDTNHAQYRLLQLLAAEHGNVFAVGDPDQCLVEGTMVTMADGSLRPIEHVSRATRCSRASAAGASGPRACERPPIASPAGIAITTASGRRDRLDAGAHAFRGLQVRDDTAAPHDVPDVEARRRLPRRDVADVHGRAHRSPSPARRFG